MLYRLDYTYAINDVVLSRSEYDSTTGVTSIVRSSQNDRERLEREVRSGLHVDEITNTCDGLRSRRRRREATGAQSVVRAKYCRDAQARRATPSRTPRDSTDAAHVARAHRRATPPVAHDVCPSTPLRTESA